MPYITDEERQDYDAALRALVEALPDVEEYPGDLVYVLTSLALGMLYDVPGSVDRPKIEYVKLNAVIGALEATKLELYRQHVAPYEDLKRAANGDVKSPVRRLLGMKARRLAGLDRSKP